MYTVALLSQPCMSPQVVRDVTWNLSNEDLRNFVERNHGKELDGVYVRVCQFVCLCTCMCL